MSEGENLTDSPIWVSGVGANAEIFVDESPSFAATEYVRADLVPRVKEVLKAIDYIEGLLDDATKCIHNSTEWDDVNLDGDIAEPTISDQLSSAFKKARETAKSLGALDMVESPEISAGHRMADAIWDMQIGPVGVSVKAKEARKSWLESIATPPTNTEGA